MSEQPQNHNVECLVFIDDSNLWIEGQKVQAKELKDTSIDKRFRVHLGKFLKLVTKERHIFEAFLYGSKPPPNDTVWKAAKKENYKVKVFERSGSGKEKQVDVEMTSDIIENLCTLPYPENMVFIIVTGDRDLIGPIKKVLNKGITVELWSWKHSLATSFRQLANDERLPFTVQILDDVKDSFGYTAYLTSTGHDKDINPEHAVVFKDLPDGKKFLHWFARNYIARLMHCFYITIAKCSESKKTQDLIFEFPALKPEKVLTFFRRLNPGEYQPISYPEYKSVSQEPFSLKITNQYEPLYEQDEESPPEVMDDNIEADIYFETMSDGDDDDDKDNWFTKVYGTPGKYTRRLKQREIPCPWSDHCVRASECRNKHNEFERALFEKLPAWNFKFRKTKLCNKPHEHITLDQRKWCMFAHDESDSWCLGCKRYGHLTDNCKVQPPKKT